MTCRQQRISFIIILLVSTCFINAQSNFQFQQLTKKEGLPSNLVRSAIMDNQQQIWFGTHEGLARWDGFTLTPFLYDEKNPTSISGAVIMDMEADESGHIWVACYFAGLNKLNPKTEKFEQFYGDRMQYLTCLQRGNGGMWIGTYGYGLHFFDFETQRFSSISLSSDISNSEAAKKRNTILDITPDFNNPTIFWLACSDGLVKLNTENNMTQYYPSTAANSVGMTINSVLMDEPNRLWMAADGGGIVEFDIKKNTWEYYSPRPQKWAERSPLFNIIYKIARKSPTEFWVSSGDSGFGIFNTVNHSFEFFPYNPRDVTSIGSTNGRNLYLDSKNRFWGLSEDSGISFWDENCEKFHYTATPKVGRISDFAQQSNGDFYAVGWQSKGMMQLTEDGAKKLIQVEGREGREQLFTSVLVDQKEEVWVGGFYSRGVKNDSWGGFTLLKLDKQTQKLKPVQHPDIERLDLQKRTIRYIFETQSGNLYFASDDRSVIRFSPEKDRYEELKLPPNNIAEKWEVLQIVETDDGRIWVSTGFGLFFCEPNETEFSVVKGTELKRVSTIAKAANNEIWFPFLRKIWYVTPDNPTEGKIKKLTNIPTVPVNRVLFDDKNRFWMTTESGLYGKDADRDNFKYFGPEHGITQSFFYRNGMLQLKNGDILLGQNRGFYRFNPNKILYPKIESDIYLTQVELFDTTLHFDQPVRELEALEFSYQENFLTIHYSITSYCHQDKIRFAHQLQGIDKDWITDDLHYAKYTSLPPGNYTLFVKQTDLPPGTEAKTLQLPIRIWPPWWATIWAYVIYAILAGMIIFWWYRFQLKQQLSREEAKRIKEIDQMKTRLYANITHEFRTPITVIKGITAEIKNNDKSKELIQRNADNLLNLITQLLDLSKLESGKMELDLVQDNLIAYLKYLIQSYHSLAFNKKINLSFSAFEDKVWMDFDKEKMRQIIANLVSNAIKFTPEYGNIMVMAKKEGDTLSLSVKDSGIGISAEELPLIFDRFQQAENNFLRKAGGTGIGLALVKELVHLMEGKIEVKSKIKEGTEFLIHIPITNNAPLAIAEEGFEIINAAQDIPNLTESIIDETSEKPILLIIEDNYDIVKYLQTILSKNYQLLIAHDGEEGIEKALEYIPDIIISDVMMPKKDGFEVVQVLKKDVKTSHIPIVLLTARADMEGKLAGLGGGADAYLTKPFNKKELSIRLEKLIELRQQLQLKYQKFETTTSPQPVVKDDLESQFLTDLDRVILENIDNEDFKVEPHLCRAMLMSRAQLYRKIKALKNVSPAAYMRSVRMKKAHHLILSTNKTLGDIASEVGFKDQSHFTKVFSAEFGKKPNEIRN